MQNVHLNVFDSAIVSIIDHDCLPGNLSELSAFGTNQSDRFQTVLVCPLKGFDQVR